MDVFDRESVHFFHLEAGSSEAFHKRSGRQKGRDEFKKHRRAGEERKRKRKLDGTFCTHSPAGVFDMFCIA